MTSGVRAQMFAEPFEVFNIVFENISRRYDRAQKEDFYAHISMAMFPGLMRRHQWNVIDRSRMTVARRDFIQLHICLTDSAALWFMNLRMLQIRVKLGLKDYYYLKPGFVNIRMCEVIHKIRVLTDIVGVDRLFNEHRPQLRPVRTIRDFPRMAIRRRDR